MNSKQQLTATLFEVFRILSIDSELNFIDSEQMKVVVNQKPLIQINHQKITFPVPSESLLKNTNPLENEFVDLEKLKQLFAYLSETDSIIGLNHIGFCYKVMSQAEERERIKNEIAKTDWHLYEMDSNDEGLWLFMGNKGNWQDPLIELLPVEKTDDKWVNYWLPHIQIDIDTKLSHHEIEEKIISIFDRKIVPFRSCVIEGVVYGVRARLGIVSGVNIALDFATKERKIQYSREHLLKVIV